MVSTFDRDAVLEQLGKAIHANLPVSLSSRLHTDDQDVVAAAVLPVIVDAALAPIEALHRPIPSRWSPAPCSCGLDLEDCLTAQAIAEIKELTR